MKKQLLSAAVLLGLAGGATAVNLNDNGMGQVLLYPYYTVNNGKDSLFNVVNTNNEYKAVKIRINEGANTWEVLDFNVYLSPYDVFTWGITRNKAGKPVVISNDKSCVMPSNDRLSPENANGGEPLRPLFINAFEKGSDAKRDEYRIFSGLSEDDRLMEGHIELIEMGLVQFKEWKEYILHSNGVPEDCAKLTSEIKSNKSANFIPLGPAGSETAPTGGLFGNGVIVDVANGSSGGYNATAIDDYLLSSVHTDSGNSLPNLNGNLNNQRPDEHKADTVARIIRDNQVYNVKFDHPIQALGATLMADKVYNTYDKNDDIKSGTDWVISFPTKHAHVNNNTLDKGGQLGLGKRVEPFVNGFCSPVTVTAYDTEERSKQVDSDFSPVLTSSQEMCYETSVLEFSSTQKPLGSKLANELEIPSTWQSGWAELYFPESSITGAQIVDDNGATTGSMTLYGLPVIGFAYVEGRNEFLGDKNNKVANYGMIHNHRYSRAISTS